MPANQSTPEVTFDIRRNPESIWLSPICDDTADHGDGRTWASPAPEEVCEDPECGEPWVRYVREDLATPARGGDELREALADLLDYADRNECTHEETHRGGAIWTICDGCGQKWADDEGGFKPYEEPSPLTRARLALFASTDMAGAGEKTREALIATKAMYEVEIALLRNTLIAMGRMIPGVALHDEVSSSFLALLPTELAAALNAPPVEGLTSGEGWQSIDTAPKDGSWFIADGGGLDRPTPMKWCARVGAWECDAVMLEDWDQQPEGYSRPLFWLAIPSRTASPKATATASVREDRPDDEALDPHLPESIRAEKRCVIQRSDWMTAWFVPWSPRNDNQNAEGPWSHWVALANAILAADAKAIATLTDSGTAATIGGERA